MMTPPADILAGLEWIAVDWGTTHLRATAMGAEGPIETRQSDDGMGRLTPAEFEPALLRLIGSWLPPDRQTDVLACGMVGSRQGWAEAKYRKVPCTPLDQTGLRPVATMDSRINVHLAPGLSQASPADVMRGEETQIAGALRLHPSFDGVICLPGTHSKWVHVSAGEVVSFQTFMTGEMFDLLSRNSVLRHGMIGEGWDDAAFEAALAEALSRPERLAARLFTLRAEGLLTGLAAGQARSRLSGLLIGTELAASKPYWLGQPILIIGAESLTKLYAKALEMQGVSPRSIPGNACTIAGLTSLRSPR